MSSINNNLSILAHCILFVYCIFIDRKCECFYNSALREGCLNLLGGVYEI